jgi:transcriptional regulator with XRE-family HTH domain
MDDKGEVGAALRRLRQRQGMTARGLALRAGVSASYLSRLENGQVSPTVSTLTRIVQAMDQTLAGLFAGSSSSPVVRVADRRLIKHRGVDDYILTAPNATRLEVLETRVAAGADSGDAYSHPGEEECVLVLSGQLVIWVNGHQYELNQGDAITFPCREAHKWENRGSTEATILWIITPPAY